MKITLDHNAIVDLEENRKGASSLRQLIALHIAQKITIRVCGIGASEKKRDGTYPLTFSEFEQKVAAVGLAGTAYNSIIRARCL